MHGHVHVYAELFSCCYWTCLPWSEVYCGEYDGKKVAIKSSKHDYRRLQHFLAEAAVMTGLSHPHLVQLIGVSLDEKPVFIVTEFMEKGSLLTYLRSQVRAIIQKLDQLEFARDVADGMAYLEHKDLIHRWEGRLCSVVAFDCVPALNQGTLLPVGEVHVMCTCGNQGLSAHAECMQIYSHTCMRIICTVV